MSAKVEAATGPVRRLYDWTLEQAEKPSALWILAVVAFVESSIFPIPPDVMLIPMCIAARDRAFRIALVATVASVIGGYAGYAIGWALYDTLGVWILELYGAAGRFEEFRALYEAWGFWVVGGAGLTPFPYKVVTILSGLVAMDPYQFGIASVFGRGIRFFALAALLWWLGPPIRDFVDKYFAWLTVLAFLCLIGGFAVLAWI